MLLLKMASLQSGVGCVGGGGGGVDCICKGPLWAIKLAVDKAL